MSRDLKTKTAHALLWSSIDKIFTQICYAVTGIILANILMPEDFGLIAIVSVFMAFANIFVDGGFSLALIQKKSTTGKDYSTIFFFNMGISFLLYVVLYISAPAISSYFEEERIINLSRVLFLNIIFLSLSLVQSSILMREMNLKKQTIINAGSLLICSVLALWMTLNDFGVWALVFQTLSYSLTRTLLLWITTKWIPTLVFNKQSLKSIFNVGSNILLTSFVRTLFQNIYSLIIGKKYTLNDLGYYNQADRWSKMGTMAFAQAIGSATLPALSAIQDEKERMRNAFGKIIRTTSYLAFPVFIWLIIMSQSIFHCLFHTKWDPSILLFQLLIIKGLIFIFISLLNNYIMATGKTRILFYLEVIKDITALIAIAVTLPISIPAMVIGQVVVELIHYIVTSYLTAKHTGYTFKRQILDMLPYVVLSLAIIPLLILLKGWIPNEYIRVTIQGITAVVVYFVVNKILNSTIQREILQMIRGKKPLTS